MLKPIFIVGFMGVGKTSFGQHIANRLNIPFVDTDAAIEKQEDLTIAEIFRLYGEEYFRRKEAYLVEQFCDTSVVISCGGGLPCYFDNILHMRSIGLVIWLDELFELVYPRIVGSKRPLSQNTTKEKLNELKTRRELFYRMAHLKLHGNDGNQIIEILKSRNDLALPE